MLETCSQWPECLEFFLDSDIKTIIMNARLLVKFHMLRVNRRESNAEDNIICQAWCHLCICTEQYRSSWAQDFQVFFLIL